MIGYLHGSTIKQLLAAGVTQVWYGTSETPGYYGDLVSVYFFNKVGIELAHQTQMAGQLGIPDVTLLTRTWGELILARGYQRTFRWNAFMVDPDQLQDDVVYRVV